MTQQSTSGGKVATEVGARAEERNLGEATGDTERATARDNPEQQKRQGQETAQKVRKGDQAG